MATKKPCFRCGGGRIMEHFKHVERGVCFRCGGSGEDPGPSKRGPFVAPKASRQTATKSEDRAKAALAQVKLWLEIAADSSRWDYTMRQGYDHDEVRSGMVRNEIAGKLAEVLLYGTPDLFNRAVARARVNIPAKFQPDLERGLRQQIQALQNEYEDIVWEG